MGDKFSFTDLEKDIMMGKVMSFQTIYKQDYNTKWERKIIAHPLKDLAYGWICGFTNLRSGILVYESDGFGNGANYFTTKETHLCIVVNQSTTNSFVKVPVLGVVDFPELFNSVSVQHHRDKLKDILLRVQEYEG